jgi:dipeptidyl aminopeptidase/acylaminoacyl peptidase
MKRMLAGLVIIAASGAPLLAQGAKRPLSLDDLARLKDVRDPQCSPDGKSVAFVVSQIDVKEDKPGSGHIWTVGIDGQNERQITSSPDSESSPRFSPDGNSSRSPRRAPARRRGIRCGCSIEAAAKRSSSPS